MSLKYKFNKATIYALLIFLFLFTFNKKVFSQTNGNNFALPTVLSPAPQAAALGRYGDIPVAINTGVPNISVPFFTITSGKLSLPVSINYHASGVKVMDMASPTGLEWALSAGGDISRVVQGQPDEAQFGFPTVRFPNPNDPTLAAKEKCLAGFINNTYSGSINATDGQPDLFFFSVGNKSGQFVSKNAISNYQQPGYMTTPYFPINIAMSNNYQNFTITDDDGTQYFFNRADSSSSNGSTAPRIITYATAWHLVKMRSADKADSIIFKYGILSQFGYSTNPSRILQLNYDGESDNPTQFSYSVPTSSAISTKEYLLSEIDFKNGKVTLDYGNAYATNQTMVLNAVHLYNFQNGNYKQIKKYTLYHSPFINNSTVNTNVARLDSIRETGYSNSSIINKPATVFSYFGYGGFQCPPFSSFAQDFWGYFNGQTGNTDLDFVIAGTTPNAPYTPLATVSAVKRLPDSNYMKVGSLLSIKYPTGGVTNLFLQANQIALPVTQNRTIAGPVNGLNIYISNFGASPNSSAGFAYTFRVDSNYAAIYQSGVGPYGATFYNAKLTFEVNPGCTSGNSNCIYDQAFVQLNDITSGAPGPIVTQLSVSSPSSTTPSTQTALFNLTQGHSYTLSFPYQPQLTNGSANFQYRLDANVTAQMKSTASVVLDTIASTCLTGGLRVQSITSSDGFGHTIIKKYAYPGSYFNSSLFNGNYGTLANNFSFTGVKVDSAPSLNPPPPGMQNGSNGFNWYGPALTSYSPNLSLPLGSVSNNAISYNEVVEYESDGSSNYNGKTVYDYNSLEDIVTMNMPFFRISNENARSLLKEKRIYKAISGGYSLIKDQLNNYSDLDSIMNNADTVVFYTAHALYLPVLDGATPGQQPSTPGYNCFACNNYTTANQFLISRYYYTTSRFVLRSSSVADIDNNGNAITTSSSFAYQNPLHAFPTHTTAVNSAGKTIDTYMSYVLDQVPSPSCTNSCTGSLNTQLSSINATYFGTLSNEYVKYTQFENSNGTFLTSNGAVSGILTVAQLDSVVKYQNLYAQSMTNYQSAIDAAVNSYNTCNSSYNTCLSNYYTTATTDQKGILDLQAQNNILPVIQTTTYTNSVLNSTVQNYFQSYYPGVTKPSRVMFSTASNALETRVLFNQYDQFGNSLQLQKAGGPNNSYIYDYLNAYPIAEVTNAAQADIAYTSFEADGSGNWTIVSAIRDTVTATVTGNKSYLLSNGSISKSGLSTSTTYIISYWTRNASPYTITGAVAGSSIQGVTLNGWTYFQVKVSGVSSVMISGTNNIDELRLYPVSSLMTTYTFTPLVGMTSQCAANSEIVYYLYDGLQRLSEIRDQYGNIIKHMDYHYAGQ
jgi:hypothetical protein